MSTYKSKFDNKDVVTYKPVQANRKDTQTGQIHSVKLIDTELEGLDDENPNRVVYGIKNANFGNIEEVPENYIIGIKEAPKVAESTTQTAVKEEEQEQLQEEPNVTTSTTTNVTNEGNGSGTAADIVTEENNVVKEEVK